MSTCSISIITSGIGIWIGAAIAVGAGAGAGDMVGQGAGLAGEMGTGDHGGGHNRVLSDHIGGAVAGQKGLSRLYAGAIHMEVHE